MEGFLAVGRGGRSGGPCVVGEADARVVGEGNGEAGDRMRTASRTVPVPMDEGGGAEVEADEHAFAVRRQRDVVTRRDISEDRDRARRYGLGLPRGRARHETSCCET
jgi:hypothetical protein